MRIGPRSAELEGRVGRGVVPEEFAFTGRNDPAAGTVSYIARRVGNKNVKSLRRPDTIQNLEAKAIGEALAKGDRQGLTGRDAEADAGEIEVFVFAMEIQQSRVIGRHGKEEGGTMT